MVEKSNAAPLDKQAAKADREMDGNFMAGLVGTFPASDPGQRHAAVKPGWIACQDDFMPTRFSGKKKRPQLGDGLRPLKVLCVSLVWQRRQINEADQSPFRFLE